MISTYILLLLCNIVFSYFSSLRSSVSLNSFNFHLMFEVTTCVSLLCHGSSTLHCACGGGHDVIRRFCKITLLSGHCLIILFTIIHCSMLYPSHEFSLFILLFLRAPICTCLFSYRSSNTRAQNIKTRDVSIKHMGKKAFKAHLLPLN